MFPFWCNDAVSVFVAGESQGQWVWVDTDAEVAVGARVKVTPSGQRLLVDDEGKVNTGVAQRQDVLVVDQGTFRTQFDPLTTLLQERSLTQELEASLRVMHPTLAEGVDDMVNLGEMTEAGLLRNLMLRYKQGVIYVRKEKNITLPFSPCI